MQSSITETEILDSFEIALRDQQFLIYYQPQINHSTGRMVGAEALVRWQHPEKGFLSPFYFISLLEEHNLIWKLDLYVFEEICVFLKKAMDTGIHIVPISFNLSRLDIAHEGYLDAMETIRVKYQVPVRFLRAEITESSAIGGIDLVTAALEKLHAQGYLAEMDDFGSGYSSLNVLKDLPIDILKLDLRFLDGNLGGRGGIIVSSIARMAKWLNTPVIAEGVETIEQADFMQSIGVNYLQGYLYSRPLPETDFLSKLQETRHEPLSGGLELIQHLDAGQFWDPTSLETLIFSHYVGAAAIFTYQNGAVEILRANEKYQQELGMNLSVHEIVRSNPWEYHDEESHRIYEDTMQRAIASGEEETCETWRCITSKCCGEDRICIRSTIRVIGVAGNQYLFYAMIQNVTKEKQLLNSMLHNDHLLRAASEHANMYAWEYDISTKQMRPCFRCMRDLGLPPLLENYPEPVIASGLFPPDYADMYRDWHRQLAEGIDHLEAVIPLTVGRIPFHVRYTTEYDENGRPLKAYGSATFVVDA